MKKKSLSMQQGASNDVEQSVKSFKWPNNESRSHSVIKRSYDILER